MPAVNARMPGGSGACVCFIGCRLIPHTTFLCSPWPRHPPADGKAVLPWSPGDLMLTYMLQDGAWLTLRVGGRP